MKQGWMRHLDFMVVDLCSMFASCGLTFLLPDSFRIIEGTSTSRDHETLVVLALLYLTVAFLTGTHDRVTKRGYYLEFMSVLRQVLIVAGCYLFYFIYVGGGHQHILRSVTAFSLVWLWVMYVARILWKRYLFHRYDMIRYTRQVLVVTTREEALRMMPSLAAKTIRDFGVCGLAIVDEDMTGQRLGEFLVAADRGNLLEYADRRVVDEAFLNIPGDPGYEMKLANEFLVMGIKVHIYMQRQYEELPNKCSGRLFGYDVLTSSISAMTFRQALIKRTIDIVGGVVGLLLAVLIGIVIGPAIYIKSPGNILFSQIRVGKNGRKFRIYKFRSMYLDAEERKSDLLDQNEMKGQMFKIRDDPRIIKGIGHFIRRTSLDEFPQFWNVLKGDMSLVGTRPPTVDEYEQYEAHHKRRLSIRPGITGLWQISGRSDIMDFEEVVKLDVEYIEHYSLEMDIKILAKTVLAVLQGKGAE